LPAKLELIIKSSPRDLEEYIGGLTPAKAFGGQMSNFVKSNKNDLFMAIEKLIAMLVMSVNVGKTIQPNQASSVAMAIYKRYYFYSLDEIALVFRKGKQGDYGILYDKLDEGTIMEWFKKYDMDERMPYVENFRTQQNNETENTEGSLWNTSKGKEFLKSMVSHFEAIETDEDKFKKYREEYINNKINGQSTDNIKNDL
jgi:hypothetical protein